MKNSITATADLRIADIMSPTIQSIAPTESLNTAVTFMSEHRISCLIVEENKHPVGILTERDMVKLLHANANLCIPVRDVMSTPVLTVRANLDFRAAYSLLRHKGVRHLVVTNDQDQIVGLASETDFRNHLGRDVFQKIQNMSATMDRDILSLPPGDSLSHALDRMICEKWDYIIVVEHNKPLGIITERDIPSLLAQHTNPTEIRLEQVMTSPVLTVPANASVTETIATMTQQHIRHMVVVNDNGDVAGVISQHRVLELLGIEVLEDAWRTSEEQYRALVNTIREVIYQTDAHGQWCFLNPAWEVITGYSVEGSIGERNTRFIHPDDRSRYAEHFNQLMNEEISEFKDEIRYLNANGEACWVELYARLTRDRDGKPIGTTGTLFNIAERKAAEMGLKEAAKAEASAHRAKSQFLANMSHELRTPLNGILGMSDLMLMTHLDSEQADYAKTLRQSANALMGVINQILEYSNLENGDSTVTPIHFNPTTLCKSLEELFTPETRLKGLSFSVELSADMPKLISADSSRIRIVLLNLLSNAVKFTPAGQISMSIKASLQAGKTGLEVSIGDTGIGMSPEITQKLFSPFYQGEDFITRRFEGTGLGLIICKRNLELIGGSIAVQSEEGKGSRFTVFIPYQI